MEQKIVAKVEPYRFDLGKALERSLEPVTFRELERRNFRNVRLLRADTLQGSIRDAIERAIERHRDEMKRLRATVARLEQEAAALRERAEAAEREAREGVAAREALHQALAAAEAASALSRSELGAAREESIALRAECERVRAEANALGLEIEEARRKAAAGEAAMVEAERARNEKSATEAELARVRAALAEAERAAVRAKTELEEARARLASTLVDRERFRQELAVESTQEIENISKCPNGAIGEAATLARGPDEGATGAEREGGKPPGAAAVDRPPLRSDAAREARASTPAPDPALPEPPARTPEDGAGGAVKPAVAFAASSPATSPIIAVEAAPASCASAAEKDPIAHGDLRSAPQQEERSAVEPPGTPAPNKAGAAELASFEAVALRVPLRPAAEARPAKPEGRRAPRVSFLGFGSFVSPAAEIGTRGSPAIWRKPGSHRNCDGSDSLRKG